MNDHLKQKMRGRLTRYMARLPNSSLRLESTNGASANPNVYVDSPAVAARLEQFKSRIIEGYPVVNVDEPLAGSKNK